MQCYLWSKEYLLTTDPRATMKIKKVKNEKRGALAIADFSIPWLGILKHAALSVHSQVKANSWLRQRLQPPPWWSLLVYWVFIMDCAWLITMMHSDNIRHAKLRFLYKPTNCAFITLGPFPFWGPAMVYNNGHKLGLKKTGGTGDID